MCPLIRVGLKLITTKNSFVEEVLAGRLEQAQLRVVAVVP